MAISDYWPYEKDPKRTAIVHAPGKRHPFGVALCDGKFYIIEAKSETVFIRNSQPPYELSSSIAIKDLSPRDIVSSETNKALYIADPFAKCVYRLNAQDPTDHTRLIDNIDAFGLFVREETRQLLVTSPETLYIHGIDGQFQKRMALPLNMDAMHSVLTKDGTVFVCHTGRENVGHDHQVSELDLEGNVLRVFGGQKGSALDQFSNPTYLEVDRQGRVFVADYFNSRIVLLDSKLRFLQILLTADNLTHQEGKSDRPIVTKPHRVRHLETGELLVSTDKGGLLLFKIRSTVHR